MLENDIGCYERDIEHYLEKCLIEQRYSLNINEIDVERILRKMKVLNIVDEFLCRTTGTDIPHWHLTHRGEKLYRILNKK